MCQLILVNLRNPILNGVFLLPLLEIDATGNQDGTGFLSVTDKDYTLYKTAESPGEIVELGLDIKDNIGKSKYPIMAHVRAASKGIPVTVDNAHPFDGKRFILAHNGRLYKKSEQVVWNASDSDTSKSSDSLEFLEELDKAAEENPKMSMLELLNSTMDKHMGKFALLIYDKFEDVHYICRGSTADLHVCNVSTVSDDGVLVTPIGYVVNTKKIALKDSAYMGGKLGQLATGLRLKVDDPTELKKDTLYKVDGVNLVELGEVKENSVTYTKPTYHDNFTGNKGAAVNTSLEIWRLGERLLRFINEHFLSIADLDAIFYVYLGVCLGEAELEDFRRFISKIIPKISARRDIRDKLKSIMDSKGIIYPVVYTKVPGLSFPWMVSDKASISKLIDYLKMEVK